MALAATQHYYTLNQISQSVLPSLCGLTSDPEREVRDQAFKVIKGFLGKLEKVSEDPSLKESMGMKMFFSCVCIQHLFTNLPLFLFKFLINEKQKRT